MAAPSELFQAIDKFEISLSLLQQTIEALRREGRYTVESILFWAGRVSGTTATITHIIIPNGPGVTQHPLQVRIDEMVMAAICDLVDPPTCILLGQVHTHMGEAFHSRADDQNSLDTPGYLSMVVPYAARDGAEHWLKWAFFECLGGQRFRQMDTQEVSRRFIVNSDERITIHEARAHE